MRNLKSLFIVLTLAISVMFMWARSVQAQQPLPPEPEQPDQEVIRDPELMALWRKYSYLIASEQVSLEALQEMIANEKSEKARLLGIKVRIGKPEYIGPVGEAVLLTRFRIVLQRLFTMRNQPRFVTMRLPARY